MRLKGLERHFVDLPTHAKRECQQGSPYEQAFCEAKQFAAFNERFVQKLWEEINQMLCPNRDLGDPHGHDDLCRQARRLSERVEKRRVDALGQMIKHSEDRPQHHEILGLHLEAAGGLPPDAVVHLTA